MTQVAVRCYLVGVSKLVTAILENMRIWVTGAILYKKAEWFAPDHNFITMMENDKVNVKAFKVFSLSLDE